jgi:hypothetical protein
VDAAEQLARFGVVAQKLDIDVGGIAQAMPLFGDAVQKLEVGMSAAGDALAVGVAAPREADWPERVGRLADAFGVDKSPLPRVFAARHARAVRLELATTAKLAGAAATVRWLEAAPLAEDLTNVVLAGLSDATRIALEDRATFLAHDGTSRGFALRFALGEPIEVGIALELPSDTTATGRLLALARELGIGDAQRALLERVHTLLAVGGSAIVELWAQPRGLRPQLAMTWDAARWNTRGWDTALRVVTGLHPTSEAARRVGTFQGALGGAEVSRISIAWGPDDPPPAWVWATRV